MLKPGHLVYIEAKIKGVVIDEFGIKYKACVESNPYDYILIKQSDIGEDFCDPLFTRGGDLSENKS